MSNQQIITLIKQWLEDIDHPGFGPNDMYELDKYSPKQQVVFLAGVKLGLESLLNYL